MKRSAIQLTLIAALMLPAIPQAFAGEYDISEEWI